MTPALFVAKLLSADSNYPNNRTLLKKIINTACLGRLQVNGLAPDDAFTMAEYLFDEEQIIFDYTRLTTAQRQKFQTWLLEAHQEDKTYSETASQTVNEYRGFTAQVSLNWWGRIKKFFGSKDTELWQLADRTLSLEYQLTSVTMCHGKDGTLIGFNQLFNHQIPGKYSNPKFPKLKPLGNTKRVFITDNLVDLLVNQNLATNDIIQSLNNPHPHSISVQNIKQRYADMYNYRNMQKFTVLRPWFWRIWQWFLSWFPKTREEVSAKNFELLLDLENVQVLRDASTEEVMVTERKPDIQNLVFCGGGPKIFGHVGVWRALLEANIRPTRFSGSSAGAIMSLMCYLGYTADEINTFFSSLQQEHIVYYEFDRTGISDTKSLKTALDYAVAYKLNQITSQYDIPYPTGKITFAAIENVRQQCLAKGIDCGIGERLIITTTKRSDGSAKYYSLDLEPNEEITETVKISASLPIMYRPTVVGGEVHTDGSMSSNLPTEVFTDDHSTFLESEFGINLKVMAVQFDTGTERDVLANNFNQVYRENVFLNSFYSITSGINDPATAWEQDRLKLRKYAAQSVIVEFDGVPSSFSVSQEMRQKMGEHGYAATRDYLDVRYCKKEDGTCKSDVYMYSSFNSLSDLLSYCCYRGDFQWFNRINDLIVALHLPNKQALIKKSLELRVMYFSQNNPIVDEEFNAPPPTFFGNPVPAQAENEVAPQYPNILLKIYPIFLKISSNLVKDKSEQNKFDLAHHAITINTPFACLEHLSQIKGEMHILLYLIMELIKALKDTPSEEIEEQLQQVQLFLEDNTQNLLKPEFYGKWNLDMRQSLRIFKMLQHKKMYDAAILCSIINQVNAEPLPSTDELVSGVDFIEGEDLWYLFPILLKLCANLTKTKSEKAKIEHAISTQLVRSPMAFADFFTHKTNATNHILISSIVNVVLQLNDQPSEKLYRKFNRFMNYFYINEKDLLNPVFYGKWNLSEQQSERIMQYFLEDQVDEAVKFCSNLIKEQVEPLQEVDDYAADVPGI